MFYTHTFTFKYRLYTHLSTEECAVMLLLIHATGCAVILASPSLGDGFTEY